jgi:hypothetical protein
MLSGPINVVLRHTAGELNFTTDDAPECNVYIHVSAFCHEAGY